MQVQTKGTFFQSFGGINFMESDFKKIGFTDLITSYLGVRSLTAVYSYSDIIKTIFYIHAIGGDVLDDVKILQEQLKDHPDMAVCSADTIEYVTQELKQSSRLVVTDKKVTHTINEHAGFNQLLTAMCKRSGLLNTTDTYTMDYDGHSVENTKPDNARTYKQTEGYYPVICSVNKLPVYMQNRKGNTPESYNQLAIIQKAFENCDDQNIKFKNFRADACCYEKETIAYLESRTEGIKYYIRADMNTGLRIALEDEPQWEPAMLNHQKVEVCAIEHEVFGQKKPRRIVAYRKKTKGQLRIEQRDGYSYHAILTSDTAHPMEVITFYNQRGCEGEHHFKELDYDFGWSKLPFDNIEMNTIYMYATIVGYLLFNTFKYKYSTKLDFVKPEMRLKNFILHFVTLTAKWIKKSRQRVLQIFTSKDYSPLWASP
jgi:hypothetical protein